MSRASRSGVASVLGIRASLEVILAAPALHASAHARATHLRRRRQTRPAQRRRHEPSEVRHSPPQLQKHVGASSARRGLPPRAQGAATRPLRPRARPRALAPSVVPPPATAPPRAHPTTRACRELAALGASCWDKTNTLRIWGLRRLAPLTRRGIHGPCCMGRCAVHERYAPLRAVFSNRRHQSSCLAATHVRTTRTQCSDHGP